MVKRQAKKFPSNYFYKVDQGYLMQRQNDNKAAFDLYNSLISDLEKNPGVDHAIGHSFFKTRFT
jgi:hypothetical protein